MKSDEIRRKPTGRSGHPMECTEIQSVLFDYMSRELGPARSDLVRAHLRRCPDCQAAGAEIQKTIDLLTQASRNESGLAVSLSPDHRKRMSRAVMHPVLDWVYQHHVVASVLVVALVLAGLLLALRHTTIWRKDRPEPGPIVIIGEPPDAEVPQVSPVGASFSAARPEEESSDNE